MKYKPDKNTLKIQIWIRPANASTQRRLQELLQQREAGEPNLSTRRVVTA